MPSATAASSRRRPGCSIRRSTAKSSAASPRPSSTRSMAIDRRDFVGVGALGLFGLVHARAGAAPGFEAPEPAQDVTRRLAAYVVHARIEDVPAPIRAEACRTLLNWAG